MFCWYTDRDERPHLGLLSDPALLVFFIMKLVVTVRTYKNGLVEFDPFLPGQDFTPDPEVLLFGV
jgi:hypothetical protein